jgi:hypothetical protein
MRLSARAVRSSVVMVLAVGVLATPAAVAAQTAAWLDGPPVNWNTPGQTAPPMAPPKQNTDPRCAEREDAPSSPEENSVTGRGWLLQGYWPTVRSGDLVLVSGLADYDGMCRPWNFNVFVFSGGRYAGTLSPEPMDSRTDGQLRFREDGTPAVVAPDGSIGADFVRYLNTDPLCCPSGGTTHVTYQVRQAGASPLLAPVEIGGRGPSRPAVQVPSRLPATGTASDTMPLAAAVAVSGVLGVLLGLALRVPGRRVRRG